MRAHVAAVAVLLLVGMSALAQQRPTEEERRRREEAIQNHLKQQELAREFVEVGRYLIRVRSVDAVYRGDGQVEVYWSGHERPISLSEADARPLLDRIKPAPAGDSPPPPAPERSPSDAAPTGGRELTPPSRAG
jgi:hypothetical protein